MVQTLTPLTQITMAGPRVSHKAHRPGARWRGPDSLSVACLGLTALNPTSWPPTAAWEGGTGEQPEEQDWGSWWGDSPQTTWFNPPCSGQAERARALLKVSRQWAWGDRKGSWVQRHCHRAPQPLPVTTCRGYASIWMVTEVGRKPQHSHTRETYAPSRPGNTVPCLSGSVKCQPSY